MGSSPTTPTKLDILKIQERFVARQNFNDGRDGQNFLRAGGGTEMRKEDNKAVETLAPPTRAHTTKTPLLRLKKRCILII